MRIVILSVMAVLLLSIIAGCGGGGSASKSNESSVVSINIGGNGQTASLRVEKNTFIARASLYMRKALTATAAFAAIPQNVTHIVFTISAPDIITITRDVLISGQTSVTESFIVPNGNNRRFLVEAMDSSGNVMFRKEAFSNLNGSPVTLSLNMEDVAPPAFAGLLSATSVSSSQINLSWNPATDNLTSSSDITYNVYASKIPGGLNLTTPSFVTTPGVTSFSTRGLEPNTTYYFIVRAYDGNGNVDANFIEKSATTFDATAPTFAGLVSAAPNANISGRIDLSWNPATDNRTLSSDIVYLIYRSIASGGQDFLTPTYTTAPGATSFTVTGLSPGIYYFVVRARDAAGNADANSVERSASSDIVPPSIASVNLLNVPFGEGTTAQITVNFSEPMDSASLITPANYSVSCSGDCSPLSIDSISSTGNASVTLTLSFAYECFMTFDLTVSQTVKDLSGNPMTGNYPWTYSTGCLD